METVTALVRSIFQKESLDDCSVEELQAMASQYSYFTPVQFLLAEKLRTTDEKLYKEQLQKLSLHFNNPLWLDHLLNLYKAGEFAAQSQPENRKTKKEELTGLTEGNNSPDLTVISEEHKISEPVINEVAADSASDAVDLLKDEIFESSKNNESHEPAVEQNNTVAEIETTELVVMENNEAPISMPPLPDMNQEPAETELSFQPYHTVDYFASQGIKFIPEEKPVDRFGKQLKSFTEWLKTMKRLPESEVSKVTDVVAEKNVEQMAQHSIDEGEVITETMAEVWVKQGNREKAIETYNKLSLLNPDKSAYFASLAEQLKNS